MLLPHSPALKQVFLLQWQEQALSARSQHTLPSLSADSFCWVGSYSEVRPQSFIWVQRELRLNRNSVGPAWTVRSSGCPGKGWSVYAGLTDLCVLLPLRIRTSRSVLFCFIFVNIEFGTDGFHKTLTDFCESDWHFSFAGVSSHQREVDHTVSGPLLRRIKPYKCHDFFFPFCDLYCISILRSTTHPESYLKWML